MESWKDIKGYEGKYQISNMGNVKVLVKWCGNKSKSKWIKETSIMKPTDNGHGYLIVGLIDDQHKKKNHYVHRLVAEHFMEKPNGKDVINHKDFNKHNNDIDNLEWVTQKENVEYSRPNMMKRHKSYTSTGEQYITFKKGRYLVTIKHKCYPTTATLEEAVKLRNTILERIQYV